MPTKATFLIEFSTHNPSNWVVIETRAESVLVRAAQDNFSERRKAFLIRQLAAEGYIPDGYETYTEENPEPALTWVIDRSLMIIGPVATGRTRRFMQRLIAGGCVAFVLEVIVTFWRAR